MRKTFVTPHKNLAKNLNVNLLSIFFYCIAVIIFLIGCSRTGEIVTINDIDLVYIPGGKFEMGSESGDKDELPLHIVNLNAFYMSAREINQKQYEAVMGSNPSEFHHDINTEMPVETVSWYDAIRFCNRLSEIAGFEKCYDENTWQCDFSKNGFRLPTEAEWEYAAKAGGQGDFQREEFKAGKHDDREYLGLSKTPNVWGIYDMFGTDWEWCNDWYCEDYYKVSPKDNPTGPDNGVFRVVRGSGWYLYADFCRACDRQSLYPHLKIYYLTFRIVKNAK
jgi:formylglycine-generating enzyme required for sulfatase activity